MGDRILRMTAGNGSVLAFFAETTRTVQKAADIHRLSPVAAAALGRTLTATAILSGTLKGKNDTVTVQINGGGPLGRITTVGDVHANVKGCVDGPQTDLPLKASGKLDVGGAVGKDGKLTVIKDLGMKRPYIGSVELQTGEIAEDLAYYFSVSEQIPTVIALGVLINKDFTVGKAGGYLIQLMPGVEEETIRYFEGLLENVRPFTEMLGSGMSLEDIAREMLSGLSPDILEERETSYRCGCSYERMRRNILALGREDLLGILKTDDEIEAVCHFCNTAYRFRRETILDELSRQHNRGEDK